MYPYNGRDIHVHVWKQNFIHVIQVLNVSESFISEHNFNKNANQNFVS